MIVISGTTDAFFSINDQDAALDILMGSLSTGDILISVEEPEGGTLHTETQQSPKSQRSKGIPRS